MLIRSAVGLYSCVLNLNRLKTKCLIKMQFFIFPNFWRNNKIQFLSHHQKGKTYDLASHYCGFYVLECHCFVHLLAGLKWPCPDDTDEAVVTRARKRAG